MPLQTRFLLLSLSLVIVLPSCVEPKASTDKKAWVIEVLQDSVLMLAQQNLQEAPITVTASSSPRSAGGKHDFYSEGDYWWPDSTNPEGPYVRRDGMTNPDNFTEHRKAVVRLSEIVGNLASAYAITEEAKYAEAVRQHLKAWYITDSTRMNPNLLYAQAIKGRHTGRGIGIIDAIHFMEVVQATRLLAEAGQIPEAELQAIKAWFADFSTWLTTHPYGQKEMVHPNNHGTCWNMQVGLYAAFTENDSLLNFCRQNYQNTLLPNQMAADGSFPLELERTKPYGYSLFNLDAMAMNCLILSDEAHDLWAFTAEKGQNLEQALGYMQPYVADKATWPLAPDVMYWENWPVAHPAFLFGGLHFEREDWLGLWQKGKHFLTVKEVRRNVPIRNPLIWL
ncbi:MAG: alginate lyase family protein [Bacteroidota bacterium]